jgi:hypothetical protein
MVCLLVNNELESVQNVAIQSSFKLISRNLHEGTDENHETKMAGLWVEIWTRHLRLVAVDIQTGMFHPVLVATTLCSKTIGKNRGLVPQLGNGVIWGYSTSPLPVAVSGIRDFPFVSYFADCGIWFYVSAVFTL